MAEQDGCYAWLVCFASFLHHTIQGGIIFSVGIFYIIFRDALDSSDSAVALIPAIHFCLLNGIGNHISNSFFIESFIILNIF